jgi:hypothetical protein
VPPTTLYRLAGLAGMLSGLLLLFNTARRGGVVPANALTHGIAPLSSVLGLFALTGLYLWQRQPAWLSAALWRTASRDANAPATPLGA